MYKDYFYLLRSCLELRDRIKTNIFSDAFTQEKDILIFHLQETNHSEKYLVVSANPQFPYIFWKNEFHRAKKNTITFFKEYFPAELKNILIGDLERSIKFVFDSFEIVFLIKGPDTNLLLMQIGFIKDSFKKVNNKSELESFVRNIKFIDINQFNSKSLMNIELNEFNYKKDYPFISSLFYKEYKLRNGSSKVSDLIEEIIMDDISIYFDEFLNRYVFKPKSFYNNSKTDLSLNIFNNFNDAIVYFIRQTEINKKLIELKKTGDKFFKKNIEIVNDTLNKLKFRLDEGEKSYFYYKLGNLLTTNYNLLTHKMEQIEIEDENGEKVTIKLKKQFSPSENVKYYFDKAKDEKINYKKSQELFSYYSVKQKKLLELHEKFQSTKDLTTLENILNELKLENKSTNNSNESTAKIREYLIDGKYKVLVGKDSKSNDELSLHIANKNDYWFHARGVSGSHVVLRNDNQKDLLPKNIIKISASIAAYFSKAKTASLVPVSYTFAKYVIKRKGMEPGKVQISNENVVIVKPEIPKNCIQIGVDNEI